MLFPRISLLSMAVMLPLVLSFRLCADPLAPKQALWGIIGGILLAHPRLPGFRSNPALAFLLGLIAAMFVLTGAMPSSLFPWIIGGIILLYSGSLEAGFAKKYARLAAIVASLIALYALTQSSWNRVFTGIRLVNPFGERVPGTLGNPTFLSDYLSALLPLSLTLMSLSVRQAGFYFWGCSSLIMMAAVFASGSKGGQLASLIGTAGWAIIFAKSMPKNRKMALIPALLAMVVVAAITLTPASLMNSLARWTSSSERFSFTQRLDILAGTAKLAARSPFIGNGPGSLPTLFPGSAPSSLSKSLGLTLSVNHAHNDYAEIASDLGIIGLGLFLIALFRGIPGSFRPDLRGGFALSALSLAISMATNFAIFLPSTAFFIWMHSGLAKKPAGPLPAENRNIPSRTILAVAGFMAAFLSLKVMTASAYMRAGQDKLEAGNRSASEPYLLAASRISPGDRHIFQVLGRSLELQGKLEESAGAYMVAWRLAPYHPITAFNVARVQREIFLRSGGKDRAARGKSISALASAVKADPYLAEAREWGGDLSLGIGDRVLARSFLLDVPKDLLPASPALHHLRARLFLLDGNPSDASKESLVAGRQESRMMLSQAEAYMSGGRKEEAEALARKVVRSQPGLGAGWELLGYILHTRGALPEAIKCYRRLESLEPSSLAAQINLTMLSLSTGDKRNARVHMEIAARIAPENPDVMMARARVLAFEGNKQDSLAEYGRIIRMHPGNTQARAEMEALKAR